MTGHCTVNVVRARRMAKHVRSLVRKGLVSEAHARVMAKRVRAAERTCTLLEGRWR